MGAKFYGLFLAALMATGCSGGLARLAPPGLVKYEDLEQGTPPNPAIAERIAAQDDAPGGGFPVLADQPSALPEGIAKPERDAMLAELTAKRDALSVLVTEDRALADGERDAALESARDDLGAAIEIDDAAARRERGLSPRPRPAPEN